jgi:hypothetical protein
MIGCVLRQESPPDTRPRYLPCAPGPSGVGTFFYTPDGGLRGLEFVPADWSGGTDPQGSWSNITSGWVRGSSALALPPDMETGMANSLAIVAQGGHTA